MNPLMPATVERPAVRDFIAACMANGLTRAQAKEAYNRNMGACWKNDLYTVFVIQPDDGRDFIIPPGAVWLSIRRNDRGPIMDWRDLQAIKNQLVGPECEAVQLFPAESRLVDTANQYHLVALEDPGARFGFGFVFRAVDDKANFLQAGQRPRSAP